MKKQVLNTVGCVAATLILAFFTHVFVYAQKQGGGSLAADQTLVGSWNLVVSIRDCDTGTVLVSFPAINTYNQGGTMQQSAVPGPEGPALPGHGVWSHKTGGGYSAAFQFFSLNPNGNYVGKVVVRSAISLEQGGSEYTSTDAAEILDPSGNVVATSCSTTIGRRFE